MAPNSPIACTLDPIQFKDRTAWIAALNKSHLRHVEQSGPSLVLTYSRIAKQQVTTMMLQEQACCSFLDFTLVETDDAIRLQIEVPEHAKESADVLLSPFLSGAESATAARKSVIGLAPVSAAGAALACGACCIAPLVMPAIAVGSFGTALAWIGRAHFAMTVIAAVLVSGGWLIVYRDTLARRVRPARRTLWIMSMASMLLVAAIAWPRIESPLVSWLLN